MLLIRYNTVFVHVPKTGGSSMRRLFTKHRLGVVGAYDHSTATEQRAVLGQEVFDRAFSFAFVRNPWERVLSMYTMPKRGAKHSIFPDNDAKLTMPFQGWLEFMEAKLTGEGLDRREKLYRKQVEFILDGDQPLVKFVGRFERLAADWKRVCGVAGFRFQRLPWIARSPNTGPYRNYYNQHTRRIVERLYGEDAEYFGYAF